MACSYKNNSRFDDSHTESAKLVIKLSTRFFYLNHNLLYFWSAFSLENTDEV